VSKSLVIKNVSVAVFLRQMKQRGHRALGLFIEVAQRAPPPSTQNEALLSGPVHIRWDWQPWLTRMVVHPRDLLLLMLALKRGSFGEREGEQRDNQNQYGSQYGSKRSHFLLLQ
jgi:hypothetical protein